jgi:adsorption protein B
MDNFLQVIVVVAEFLRWSSDAFYVFAYIIAVFLLISGADDLLTDLYYWVHNIFYPRKLNKYSRESPEKLTAVEEKPIAIFIPTWQEQNVIDEMLTHACKTLVYKKYDIFVGIYPNDFPTLEKVRKVQNNFPQVHPVIGNHPGPSTKAENLNEIHAGMLKYENQTGIRYDIIVMHDAEDVIHPMSLKIHNYFIPEYDMVQLPVFPLENSHKKVVHWTYADEFAENHTKDLVARQIFNGFIPSAGVGTAYNRWLIEFVGTSFARNIFSKASMTEDYDIALRLAMGKANLLFLYQPFGINAATRALFPETFRAAVRQKTRWLIGICLQSWANIGWVGDLRFRFTLYRDRKAVITNVINSLAYIVFTYVLLYELARLGLTQFLSLPVLISANTMLWTLVVIDTGLMLWRMVHRYFSVTKIYGWVTGALSIPRLPVGNFINFTATVRAMWQYFTSRRRNKRIVWDKTSHTFPTPETIAASNR